MSDDMKAALANLQDWQQVSVVLYGEARSEPIEGVVAVANVIRNRVERPGWWGHSYGEVATAPMQFSCLDGPGKNYQRVLAVAQALAEGRAVNGKDGQPDAKYLTCAWTARGMVAGFLPQNVPNCTHYHTATLVPRPHWAQGVPPLKQIGGHVFYAGIK